jgi:hypothetical protein
MAVLIFKSRIQDSVMEIRKKTWPGLFQRMLDGKKNADLRLADFDVREGDVILFEEYDPETGLHTGRVLRKRVKNLNRVRLTDFHSAEEISEHGHWIIELE